MPTGYRRVLNVGAGDVRAASRRECYSADAEIAVGTVRGGFGRDGVAFEVVQFLDRETKGGCCLLEMLGVDAREERRLGGHCGGCG